MRRLSLGLAILGLILLAPVKIILAAEPPTLIPPGNVCSYELSLDKRNDYTPVHLRKFRLAGPAYCFEREEKPRQGFSPDAMFPIIHAGKGSTAFKIGARFAADSGARVVSFQSGERTNIVPDRATAVVEGIAAENAQAALSTFSALPGASISFQAGENGIVITAKGVPAHGAMPEEGVNAAVELATFLMRCARIYALAMVGLANE